MLDAGGRFYFAKDAVLEGSSFSRVHGDAAVAAFRALKRDSIPSTSCRPTCRGGSGV